MNGNPFIPQVEPYNANKDVLNAFMMDYNMKLQRQSQIMDIMKQLDPIQLVGDKVRMEQYDQIKGVEDYVTGLMKQRKGRITSDDLFNIQYKISELERWQNEKLGDLDYAAKSQQIFTSAPGKFKSDPFYTKMLNYINHGTRPPDGFLELQPKDFSTWLENYKFYGNDAMYDDESITYSDDGKYAYVANTSNWGPKNKKQRLSELSAAFIGQYMNDENLREGVKEYFYDDERNGYTELTPQLRQNYIDEAEMMNTDGMTVNDPVSGKQSSIPVTPDYLWAMDFAPQKIQTAKTSTTTEKMPMANWKETKERLAKEAAEKAAKDVYNPIVTTGSEAYYISNKNIKGSETNQPIITYDVKKRQSLRPLKVSKNFSLTDESIIIGYSDDLWPAGSGEDAKSYIGFADKVGKLGAYALSKEDNEIFYGVPIYTGKAFTSPKVTVKKGGKEISKKFEINPGEPVPLEVLEEMKRIDSSWEDNNIERKDMAKLVFDFGSKSMTALHPLDDYVEETFGGTGYSVEGVKTISEPSAKKELVGSREQLEAAAKQSGMSTDEYIKYQESLGYKVIIK